MKDNDLEISEDAANALREYRKCNKSVMGVEEAELGTSR